MNLKNFARNFSIDKRSGYTLVDVIRAIMFMSERHYGRISLTKKLGLCEASVRTMLKKLKSVGLLTVSTKGHVLTKKGEELAKNINRKIFSVRRFERPRFVKKSCVVFVVKGSAKKVKLGIEQRDEGMRFGSEIITLVYDGKNVKFPGTGEIVEGFEAPLSKNDVVIVSSGRRRVDMERGALAAALTLI